jgi:hypothetical protein
VKTLIVVDALLVGFNGLLLFLTWRLCSVLEKLNAVSARESKKLQQLWMKVAANVARLEEVARLAGQLR